MPDRGDLAPPLALDAISVAPRARSSGYPEPFFSRMSGREKRALGDAFGLRNFGVNLTRLVPGGESSLLHRHSKQDEFIYIVEGEPTLVTDGGEIVLKQYVNIGVAVDTDRGLLVPVVRHPEQKTIVQLAGEIAALAEIFYTGVITACPDGALPLRDALCLAASLPNLSAAEVRPGLAPVEDGMLSLDRFPGSALTSGSDGPGN